MDRPDTTPEPNVSDKPENVSARRCPPLLIVLLVIMLGLGAAAGIYVMEQSKASKVVSQNNLLNAQVVALNKKIKQQADINNGVASPSSMYKDPAGGIGLVNGAITLTLPKGWERIPQNNCSGGTIDSKAVCQDVASIAPSTLVGSDGTAKWSATIGVYNYASNDGSALSWYQSTYDGNTLASYGTPEAVSISQSPINGYSALSFEFISQEPSPTPPDYTNADFTVVHGSYAVVVNAQVQASTIYGSANAFDYRTTYLPDLTRMVQTIRFQK